MGLAAINGWSLGSLDAITAFLYAALYDIEDGIYLVEPPAYLVKHGYIPKGILLKLKKALYVLRKAPKKWQQGRDCKLRRLAFSYQTKECVFKSGEHFDLREKS